MIFCNYVFDRKVTLMFMLVALVGCSAPKSEPIVMAVNKSSETMLITDNAETSTTLLTTLNDQLYFCSNISPDATFSASIGGNVDVALVSNNSDSESKESLSEGEVGDEMVGRTPGVLVTREFLYRTCELIRNLNLDKDKAVDLFKYAMDESVQVLTKEFERTTITLSESLSDTRAQSEASTSAPMAVTDSVKRAEGQDVSDPQASNSNSTNSNDNNSFYSN